MIQTLFCIILCYFILNVKIYKHNKISFGVCIIFFVIISIENCINGLGTSITAMLVDLLFYAVYASREVYEKWILKTLFIPPYLLLFFEGVIVLLLSLISIPFIYFFNGFENYEISFALENIGWFIFLLVAHIGIDITRIYTLNTFEPTYRYVADICARFIYLLLILLICIN